MNVTTFGNRVFADDQIKMRSFGWALSNRPGVLIKKRIVGHRDRHTLGREPHGDEGRDGAMR